jgi:hypothetical protein
MRPRLKFGLVNFLHQLASARYGDLTDELIRGHLFEPRRESPRATALQPSRRQIDARRSAVASPPATPLWAQRAIPRCYEHRQVRQAA